MSAASDNDKTPVTHDHTAKLIKADRAQPLAEWTWLHGGYQNKDPYGQRERSALE